MDCFSKACVSNHDLGTAETAHVTLSSLACHESTKPGAFFLLRWQCRASLQPRRSGPFRIRPSFVHVPSHPRSSLSHPHAEVAATHVLTSSQASLRRHVRRLSSSVEAHVPRLPNNSKQKSQKKRISRMEIHVSWAHATMTKTTKSCVSTHGWGRGEEPAGRACLAMAGGLGWSGGSLRDSVHVPTTRCGAFAAAKEPCGVAEPSSCAFSLANRALHSVPTAEVSISVDATSFLHVAVTCFPSSHPVHCSTTTRSTAPPRCASVAASNLSLGDLRNGSINPTQINLRGTVGCAFDSTDRIADEFVVEDAHPRWRGASRATEERRKAWNPRKKDEVAVEVEKRQVRKRRCGRGRSCCVGQDTKHTPSDSCNRICRRGVPS